MTAMTDDTLAVTPRAIRDEMIVFVVMAALLAIVPWTGIYPFFVMQALCFALGVIEGLTKYFYPEASNTVVVVQMVLVLLVKPTGLTGRAA
jgi:branched-subunit amino acid ABC-type transport system permease component